MPIFDFDCTPDIYLVYKNKNNNKNKNKQTNEINMKTLVKKDSLLILIYIELNFKNFKKETFRYCFYLRELVGQCYNRLIVKM